MDKMLVHALVIVFSVIQVEAAGGLDDTCISDDTCTAGKNLVCVKPAHVHPMCPYMMCECPPGNIWHQDSCTQVLMVGDNCTAAPTECPPLSECTALSASTNTCKCITNYGPDIAKIRCEEIQDGKTNFPCQSYQDCNYLLGFGCTDSICQCRAGHLFDRHLSTCLPDPKGSVDQCISATDCGGNVVFHYGCVNGRCVCPVRYKMDPVIGSCVPDIGYPCADNYDCAFELLCIDSMCDCASGSKLVYDGVLAVCRRYGVGTVPIHGVCTNNIIPSENCQVALQCVPCTNTTSVCLDIDGYYSSANQLSSTVLLAAALLLISTGL